jgi:O-antigen ligase
MGFHQIDDRLAEKLRPGVTQMRIIVGAMASGVLVFLCTACVIAQTGQPVNEMANLLIGIAIGAAPLAFFASRALAAVYVRRARRQLAAGKLASPVFRNDAGEVQPLLLAELGDAGKMFHVYQTQTILAAALREGAAFLCLVVFLVTGSWAVLAVAVAMAATLLGLWPSPSGAAEWINEQLRLADAEKLLAR